jgi:REP element-mobilizing transposase RayT
LRRAFSQLELSIQRIILIETEKMSNKVFAGKRSSFMELNEPYFWTSTIRDWNSLLNNEDFKFIIVDSLKWLVEKKLVAVYAYVIMPNHIHLLWEQLMMNGKEYPKNSFEKYTSKQFLKKLMSDPTNILPCFLINSFDRKYQFWQRDPLAIPLGNRKMAVQKIEYMHSNPMQPLWTLTSDPVNYRFSSARFYEEGVDEFGILTHYMERF